MVRFLTKLVIYIILEIYITNLQLLMSLNLNALKNISVRPVNIPKIEDIISQSVVENTTDTTDKEKNIPVEKKFVGGPKISLMKLKKESWVESSIIPVMESIEVPTIQNIKQEATIIDITSQGKEEEIIINQSTTCSTQPVLIEEAVLVKESIISSSPSVSILIEEEKKEEASKEFFPNFHISDQIGIDDDLLDINKDTSPKEHINVPILEENTPTINKQPSSVLEIINIPVSAIVSENEVPENAASEIIPETSPNNTIVTPEYVTEVKIELSEQRRAGFRFFAQKKIKIIAWISFLIFSVSTIVLFPVLPDVEKSWKSNIQEITENTTLNTSSGTNSVVTSEIILPVDILPVENTPYESWHDYTITKNTKKNIRIIITPDTLTGTATPDTLKGEKKPNL